jgi:hypothetical protein
MNYILVDKYCLDPDETPDLYITNFNDKAKFILREVRRKFPNVDVEHFDDDYDGDGKYEIEKDDFKFCFTANWDTLREIEKITEKYGYKIHDESY